MKSSLFFQAEDGIRDRNVTGVQTCALPISTPTPDIAACRCRSGFAWADRASASSRSEERRVGKECRSRGSPYHSKKKDKRSTLSRPFPLRHPLAPIITCHAAKE